MLKNIVLDMGNVCCRWDPEYLASQLDSSVENQKIIIEQLFKSPQWAALDQGIVSIEDALTQIKSQHLENSHLLEYAFHHWYDYFDMFEETLELVKTLKKEGYKIYLLSNCSLQFDEYYKDKEIFSYMEDCYISARVKMLKPHIEIYEDFLNTYHLNGQECLFVDDMQENVDGAIQAGMQGYCYHKDSQALYQYIKSKS